MIRRLAVMALDVVGWTLGRLLETRLPEFPQIGDE